MAIPDIRSYQQLPLGGPTGNVDCTAWSAAILVDAHTMGVRTLRGQDIRRATDEPKPDPESPGLNLPQVDEAVAELTSGKVNLDTRIGSASLSRATVTARAIDGRWCTIQLDRGILVDRGFVTGFRGRHALTVHARSGKPYLGDPLVPRYVACTWDAVFDAAESFADGKVYSQWTRDLTPDYIVRITPAEGSTMRAFYRYYLDSAGRIRDRDLKHTAGYVRRCTPPRYRTAAQGKPATWSRQLVTISSGNRAGWLIDAAFASEIEV